MRKLKLYLDTSVWNFFFADDAPEKRDVTKELFDLVQKDCYEVYISEVVLDEVRDAPEAKREQLMMLIGKCSPMELEITEEIKDLAAVYMGKGIVTEKKENDALHVAIATVNELDVLVTWNYRHLANVRKAELFYGANLEKGYIKQIGLVTPMEVGTYES
jgi:predicted nucleic acid-binding protein